MRIETITPEQLLERCHLSTTWIPTNRARFLTGPFMNPIDTEALLTLVYHQTCSIWAPQVLEIGTAMGHTTANLTLATPNSAVIYTLGSTTKMPSDLNPIEQWAEVPTPESYGVFADRFGRQDKCCFIRADSRYYDYERLFKAKGKSGGLNFAIIDGGHYESYVERDSLAVREVLQPGGIICWHDFYPEDQFFDKSSNHWRDVRWVGVRRTLMKLSWAETAYHVAGTAIAFVQRSFHNQSGPPSTIASTTSPKPQGPSEHQPTPLEGGPEGLI